MSKKFKIKALPKAQLAGTTGGPQAAPMPKGLIPLETQIKNVSGSPRIEDQKKAEMLRAQKAKEDAEKKKRIEEYKKKEAEKKKQAEAASKWYDEEKARREQLGSVMDVAPIQPASSTYVDLESLVPSVGQRKSQERGLEMLKNQLYEQQETLRRRGFKDAYEYEKSPEGLLRDQALAAEAAWKASGEEAPMKDLGEMAFYNNQFNNYSAPTFGASSKDTYVTDQGVYNKRTGQFTPHTKYYSGSGALQGVDWMWTLPLLATEAPVMLGEAFTGLMGTQIPGMSGATLGQAINAGFIGKGLYDLPSTAGSWYDAYKSGTGDYRVPIEKTLWNAADFLGAGEAKEGAKLLAQDVKALKTLPANVLPTYRNIYRVEPTTFTKDPTDVLSGRWFGPAEDMGFYIRNLKDPNAGTRIIKTRIPTKKWESMSGVNLPEQGKNMSIGTGQYSSYAEAAKAGEISEGAAKRLSKGVPIESDIQEALSNPRLINLNEGILPESTVDMIRATKSRTMFPRIQTVEYPAGNPGREGAFMHYLLEAGQAEKPIMGIPRKYFPFEQGGTVLELTDEQIKQYRDAGYVIDDMPTAQDGAQVYNPMTYFDTQAPYTFRSGDVLDLDKLKLQEDVVVPFYDERTGEFRTQEGTFKPDQYEKVEVSPGVFVARFKSEFGDDRYKEFSLDNEFNKKYYKHYTKGKEYFPIYSTVPYNKLIQQWRSEETPQERNGGYVSKQITHFQDGGVPYNYNPFVSNEPEGQEISMPFTPQRTANDPEDYQAFLDYSVTAPENRRPDENYFYGDPNNYDHYGMWEALGKPIDFQQALEINPDWQPDPYDKMYHGFSVNPYTGVFLKSGKPGENKPGDTTWMEVAGHYLSPRAQMDTPVFDVDLQRFRYIPNKQDGGNMDPGNNALELHMFYDKNNFQKGGSFAPGQIYTFKGRPGSYYKLGDNNQILIKNEGTKGKYIPMVDPEGKRRQTLMQGFESGATKQYTPTQQSTINDFFYSKNELKNQVLVDRAEQCLRDAGGNCAGSAFTYYDKYVAPKLPGGKTSWQMKEAAGMSSGKKGANPSYDKAGESWDSWDLAGGFLDAGAKLHFTAADNNNRTINEKLNNMTQPEIEKYWRDMKLPIGTIINAGDRGLNEKYGKGDAYNVTKGVTPSNHTAIVVGYDAYGTPYIYDFGKVYSLADRNALVNSMGITNVVSPKDTLNNTFDKIKNTENFKDVITDFNLNLGPKGGILTAPGPGITDIDASEFFPFTEQLSKQKTSLMNTFGFTDKEYNEYAIRAAATALAETEGGDDDTMRWYGPVPIPSYTTDYLGIGESTGITQINPKSVWAQDKSKRKLVNTDELVDGIYVYNPEEFAKTTPGYVYENGKLYSIGYRNQNFVDKLNELGINESNYDPWNPKHQAIVTMGLLKENQSTAMANLKKNKGNKQTLDPAAVGYYQWNQPSLLTKGEAWGESANNKRFMNYYNYLKSVNKQKGGTIQMMSNDDIQKYRDAGYVIVEEPDDE